MCNGLNLCAIFWEGDLINGTGTHKRKVTRNTTPEPSRTAEATQTAEPTSEPD